MFKAFSRDKVCARVSVPPSYVSDEFERNMQAYLAADEHQKWNNPTPTHIFGDIATRFRAYPEHFAVAVR